MSGERPRALARRIAAFVDASSAESWKSNVREAEAEDRPRGHAFLLGFPRSGTTLLEQILASHPDIVALEEREILSEPAQQLLTTDAAMRRLITLTDRELDEQRSAYWRRVREQGLMVAGKVFVDKLPMNTVKLPLIAKLFPNAKILFSVRDPRDVILSCYRRHFQLNAAMFEFLTLEDAAELYCAVMSLARACRQKLPLAIHDHRYEDMIADFDKSVAGVCDFVGVEWLGAMREFHESNTLAVRSPSAFQIRRPLNREGLGQWRRYREHLAPILSMLAPWIAQFGYPEN